MNNNYEKEKPANWGEVIDSRIEETLNAEAQYSPSSLQLEDISLADIDKHMLERFYAEFPSVVPSGIYSDAGLISLANNQGFHAEMPQNLKTQPLYFILRGDKVAAFLPLENIEESRIDCYFFHKLNIQNDPILREKYLELLYRLNKD